MRQGVLDNEPHVLGDAQIWQQADGSGSELFSKVAKDLRWHSQLLQAADDLEIVVTVVSQESPDNGVKGTDDVCKKDCGRFRAAAREGEIGLHNQGAHIRSSVRHISELGR